VNRLLQRRKREEVGHPHAERSSRRGSTDAALVKI
jgi:hypothetical protein